ncbi:MAG: succinate dehydrogenase, cytochrome b556 subunit [Gammaproteobacteria bacterium]
MAAGNRPLSPHLQIYRPQISSVLSIMHRISGVFLALGIVVLAYWLNALAGSAAAYADAVAVLGSGLGKLALFFWLLAFCYHLLNGIRHLAWDAGMGFEIQQVILSGWGVLIGAAVLAGLLWTGLITGAGA